MTKALFLIVAAVAVVACAATEPERVGLQQEALEFVCPEGCTCTCSGGSGGTAGASGAAAAGAGSTGASGAGASTAGASGASGGAGKAGSSGTGGASPTCNLSAYTPSVWRATISQPSLGSGSGIVIDPSNPGTVYVAMSGSGTSGVFRTENCGASWVKLGNLQTVQQVRVNAANPNELYAGSGVGPGTTNDFFYSSNRGASWTARSSWTNAVAQYDDVYSIAVDPTNFAHVLVAFHSAGSNSLNASGIVESFNKGVTWTEHLPIAGWSGETGATIAFLFDPTTGQGNAQTWLYGTQGAGFWRTTNSGSSWTRVTTKDQSHGGNSLYYASNRTLYSGGVQHPMRSVDNGVTWTELSGTSYGYFQTVAGDGTNLYTFKWGGGALNTSTEASNGATWNTSGPTIPGGTFEFTAVDRVNRIMYVSAWEGGVWAMKLPTR